MSLDYKYSLEVVSMLLTIFLFIYLRGKRKANIYMYKIYNWMVLATFLTAAFDIIHAEAMVNIDIYGHFFTGAILIVYFVLEMSLTILFSIYVLSLAGIEFKFDPAWKLAIIIPGVFTIIAAIAGANIAKLSLEDITRISYSSEMTKGVLVFSAYYLLLWTIILLKYRKNINSNRRLYIRTFMLVHIFTLMIYYATKYAGIFTFELSLILIILIYAVQSPDEFFDKSDAMLFKYLEDSVLLDLGRDKAFTLIYIKFHNADVIYDSFGEINANKLLSQVTDYLSNINSTAVVYRESKNAFMIKIKRLDEISLHAIRENILKRFKEAFRFGDISAIFSVGMVTINAPEDIKTKEDFEEMTNIISHSIIPIEADYSYFNIIENDKESQVIEAVKNAVENNSFKVFYQPIYSTDKKKIVAAEALIRLFDDKLGFVSPEIFIPLAEREGYILTIGEFVFTEVCKFYSENKLNEKGIDYIEVNLSAVQCMQYKLADEFIAIMHKYGLSSNQINFEITETSAMQTNNAVKLNINYFLDHGTSLSLDDYGTGYSNISYLYHLPFAFMKIDKSILWSSDKNDKANITLKNIFKMAKNLKMRIVVEGVETEEHIKKLLKLECDYFQGYYFSKPICGNDFIKYLEGFTVPEVCLI